MGNIKRIIADDAVKERPVVRELGNPNVLALTIAFRGRDRMLGREPGLIGLRSGQSSQKSSLADLGIRHGSDHLGVIQKSLGNILFALLWSHAR